MARGLHLWIEERDADGRYVTGDWVHVSELSSYRSAKPVAPLVVRDIEPYRNIHNGGVIGGRRQHRDFLRAHGLVEVGNDKSVPKRRRPSDPDQRRARRDALKKALFTSGADDGIIVGNRVIRD